MFGNYKYHSRPLTKSSSGKRREYRVLHGEPEVLIIIFLRNGMTGGTEEGSKVSMVMAGAAARPLKVRCLVPGSGDGSSLS